MILLVGSGYYFPCYWSSSQKTLMCFEGFSPWFSLRSFSVSFFIFRFLVQIKLLFILFLGVQGERNGHIFFLLHVIHFCGNVNLYSHCGRIYVEDCQKVKPKLPHDPSIPVLTTQPRDYKSCQVNEIMTAEYIKATKIVEVSC